MSRPATSRWLMSDAPPAAIEIAADRVTVAGLSKGASGVPASASEPLPAGAVVPSLTALNILDAPAVAAALERALERAGIKARRAGLVIPDLAAKVSLVPFDKIPERRQDLADLISWQVRKAAPFRIEDAQMAFIEGAPHGEAGRTFVVTLARKDVVRQYEDVCAGAGAHTGIVDLASFNVINAVLAGTTSKPAGDWLLVNTTRESQTLAILRGDTLMFFRNRAVGEGDTLPELVHQTSMYYEDRLHGQGFERIVLAGAAAREGEALQRTLSERLHAPVVSTDALAPLGLLLRERHAQN